MATNYTHTNAHAHMHTLGILGLLFFTMTDEPANAVIRWMQLALASISICKCNVNEVHFEGVALAFNEQETGLRRPTCSFNYIFLRRGRRVPAPATLLR